MKLHFSKYGGLIPAIIQDAQTSAVLMLGYMNKAAYQKTRRTKRVTFYSRSKKRLWTKGETSGNFMEVVGIDTDCDRDALLIQVKPQGPACHTGAETCFERDTAFLNSLLTLINERKRNMPEQSYTASLFRAGISKIGAKVMEEAEEVARAAQNESTARTVEEISDLIYHLVVLMAELGVDWSDIGGCLIKRRR